MKYETSVVYLEQVPKIVVDTGLDLPTLISFAVTILIFALGTWLTLRNSDENSKQQTLNLKESLAHQEQSLTRTIESQEGVASKNSLKASRQGWINDLRDATSQYVAATMNVQRLNNFRQQRSRYWERLEEKDFAEHSRSFSEWAVDHIEAVKEVKRLKAKIELLLNPVEEASMKLMEAVEEAERQCDTSGSSLVNPCRDIITCCQVILKNEWEKAKSGE